MTSRSFGSFASVLFIGVFAACSSSQTAAPAPVAATDAGAKEPQVPEDVPAVRYEGDTAACPGNYAGQAPAEGLNRNFSVAGQSREFVLHLPPDSFTGPRPLLVGFNGTGESGPIFDKRAQLKDFADAGFIVLAPSSEANGTIWPVWDGMRTDADLDAPNKDLEYFDTLLKCAAGHFEVDKNRLYITGHSAGGIMTNYVAQRRSEILAGAIPASGIFSSTSPKPATDMDDMFVIVTWGGNNDKYSGSAGAGGISVPEANFVSEASLATKFYAGQKNVGQVNCQGNNLNHVWLPINDWFIKVLLEHPKGLSGKKGIELPAQPDKRVKCTTDVFEAAAGAQVTCPSSGTEGCQESCQLIADCGVENDTVKSALKPQFTKLGFEASSCNKCVTQCEGVADAEVLGCMKTEQAKATCGPGIDGAAPLITAVNKCCKGKRDSSPYCKYVCDIIAENSVAITYFTQCK